MLSTAVIVVDEFASKRHNKLLNNDSGEHTSGMYAAFIEQPGETICIVSPGCSFSLYKRYVSYAG